jgi:MtrB/PioB family decaheme-associated outer membrane protein
MKQERLLLLAGLLFTGLNPDLCPAADVQQSPAQAGQSAGNITGEIEYGVGYVSQDSYEFGRYNGLKDQGAYPIGGFDLRLKPGHPDYLHFQGADLGLESRSIELEYGRQGQFDTHIKYQQLPSLKFDSGETPYTGAGNDRLHYTGQFRELQVKTERKQLGGGISFVPAKNWLISLSASREKKEGTGVIGGALASNSDQAVVGNTVTGLLPEPIDYTTDKFDIKLGFADKKVQWELGYNMSLFDDNQDSLTWDNFQPGPDMPDVGRLALPPDNQFHQASLTAAYQVADTTRLTTLVSAGAMLQDDDFQPYRVGASTAALPENSLDGKVYVYSARLGMTSRPFRPLRLNMSYRYDERNNDSSHGRYTYNILDSDNTAGPVSNRPLNYRKQKIDLSGQYRFNRYVDGVLGYAYGKVDRDNADAEENQENSVSAQLKLHPRADLDLSVMLSRMDRDASGYLAESENQNPLVRKYYMADDKQDKAGLTLSYMPHSTVTLGLSADYLKDDYDKTSIGLTESKSRVYSADISYTPVENLVFYGFYTREDIDASQAGSDSGGAPDWQADFDDRIETFGAGVKITGLADRWDIGADFVHNDANSSINMHHDSLPAVPYPDLKNDLNSLRLYASYRVDESKSFKLSYLHEKYDSDDWAVDGVDAGPAGNTLLLGNDSPNYDVDVFMVSMRYRF